MAFITRTILIDEATMTRAEFSIKYLATESAGAETIPKGAIYKATTQAGEAVSIDVKVKPSGTVALQIAINVKGQTVDSKTVYLGAGGDINWGDLWAGGTVPTDSLKDYVDQQIATIDLSGVDSIDVNVKPKIADTVLSGHKVVKTTNGSRVTTADNQTPADRNSIFGVTTGSASSGAQASVRVFGELIEPTWSWTPGLPVFCGANGALTQTPPLTGWLCVIGTATSPTTLFIRIGQPINLI